jgi:hypothetical protein
MADESTRQDQHRSETPYAEDFLYGAKQIARYLGMPRRRVYHIASMNQMPIFRIGLTVCARKSTLRCGWSSRSECDVNPVTSFLLSLDFLSMLIQYFSREPIAFKSISELHVPEKRTWAFQFRCFRRSSSNLTGQTS